LTRTSFASTTSTGPYGTHAGGREKAPAALCRKVAMASAGGAIEVRGDADQPRSFCSIDNCTEGIYWLMASNYTQPLNLGRDRMVTINELAQIIITIIDISGKRDLRSDPARALPVLSRILPGSTTDDSLRPVSQLARSQCGHVCTRVPNGEPAEPGRL